MSALFDMDVAYAVQTELKLYMTQQLHRKGYLSDEMFANATEIILKDAKKIKEKNLNSNMGCISEQSAL